MSETGFDSLGSNHQQVIKVVLLLMAGRWFDSFTDRWSETGFDSRDRTNQQAGVAPAVLTGQWFDSITDRWIETRFESNQQKW